MRARLAAIGCVALLCACGAAPEPASDNVATPARQAPEPTPVATAPQDKQESPPTIPAEPPDDYPGVAELGPSQRRAYERGYRDCREGRYAPGEWAEAYRIGCAAAQEGG